MTKRWSATKSLDGQTKRQASKSQRCEETKDIETWLKEQGAVESVSFDEETGERLRSFKINLKREKNDG